VNPQHAAELAALVIARAGERPLDDTLRAELRALTPPEGLQPCFGSLERDPRDPSAFYLAVDAPEPLLLRFGRQGIRESVPFGSTNREAVARFARDVNPAFLPRPQRDLPAIATGNRHPEISLPAAFGAFRAILDKSGRNLASTVQLSATREMTTDDAVAARDGESPTAAGHTRVSIRHLYHAGLWAAIRAGWREGYTAEADHFIISGNTADQIARSVEAAKEAIRHAAGYTKFTTDTSRLFVLEADPRHLSPWTEQQVQEKFEAIFSASERAWILGEFSRPVQIEGRDSSISPAEVVRLAVKFGESLKLNEDLYDSIRQARGGQPFDFEPSLDEAETLTTPQELYFYMNWLKLRGRPAQLVPPNLGFKKRQAYPDTAEALAVYSKHKMWPELRSHVVEQFGGQPLPELEARIRDLAAIARHFDGTLSIHSGSGKQPAVLHAIGNATRGRVNYKISGELQLQLFDVLSEQPEASPWRKLYLRMVDRANEFAGRGAFGEESELARKYPQPYLGDAGHGRVDGNLFLVFWLGNIVGSRDLKSPDGDQRFFKEKLDELPADLLAEVRRRNTRYVSWLADNLGL
jgi:tagaturonate epimerase